MQTEYIMYKILGANFDLLMHTFVVFNDSKLSNRIAVILQGKIQWFLPWHRQRHTIG